MTSIFRPSTIADEPGMIALMSQAFSTTLDDPTFERDIMDWKYWDRREDWSQPRSYVLEQDGRIVAHAGVWPVTIPARGPGAQHGVHLIDWASDPHDPGPRLTIVQKLLEMFSFVFTIGGSPATLQELSKFGFRKVTDAVLFARPIRPFGHMMRHQNKDIRLAARLARNILWSKSPPRGSHPGWRAVPADAGQAMSGAVLRERDERFFRYLKRCPAAPCSLFAILRGQEKEGYFALAVVQGQARIAGMWMNDPAPDKWRIGFELAQEVVLRHTGAYEIVARRSVEASAVLEAAGLRPRGGTPVFLYSQGADAGNIPLEFQFADNDALFMYGLGFAC